MCKNMICESKCKECFNVGKSCCVTQPLFTNSELAEVYYETEVFANDQLKVLPVGSAHFIVTKEEWHNTGDDSFNLNSRNCMFLTNEGTCSIYEYRPSICKDYGEVDHLPCYAKDMSVEELKTTDKELLDKLVNEADMIIDKHKAKLLDNNGINKNVFNVGLKTYNNFIPIKDKKDLRFNTILYYIIHNVEHIVYSDSPLLSNNINRSHTYELVTVRDKLRTVLSSIRHNKLECSVAYKEYGTIYKKMSKYIMSKPYIYHKEIVDIINNVYNDLDLDELPDDIKEVLVVTGDERKAILNIVILLLSIYRLYTSDDIPKYITKYFTTIDYVTKLRYLIYSNISYLVHGVDSTLLIDGAYKEDKDISVFNTKLKTDVEKHILKYSENIAIIKIDRLLDYVKNNK